MSRLSSSICIRKIRKNKELSILRESFSPLIYESEPCFDLIS